MMKKIALLLAAVCTLSSCHKDKEDDNEAPVYGSWTAGGASFKATSVYRSEIGKVLTATDAFGNMVNIRFTNLPTTSNTYSIVKAPDTTLQMGISVVMAGTGAAYYAMGDDEVKGTVSISYINKITVAFPSVKAVRQGGGDSMLISGTIIEH